LDTTESRWTCQDCGRSNPGRRDAEHPRRCAACGVVQARSSKEAGTLRGPGREGASAPDAPLTTLRRRFRDVRALVLAFAQPESPERTPGSKPDLA
jgi:hypothetical protein